MQRSAGYIGPNGGKIIDKMEEYVSFIFHNNAWGDQELYYDFLFRIHLNTFIFESAISKENNYETTLYVPEKKNNDPK